ncbi:MAG: D-alanine--D-alanine ligase [Deltaproteobacteria bacterium]|nr:D-alanine--D-alanine ligase [Deltaproteobacteria bacterium]HCH62494.1 D-alanine--D-alanine ligase [Deltaproteobacteria bacterium]
MSDSISQSPVLQRLHAKLTDHTARIAVLMGGMSAERAVSMKSGKAVAAALRSRGWEVVEVDVDTNLPARLAEVKPDLAWLALHGLFGEDGCVQGLLEIMQVPYTGSHVRASAVAMDKIATKRMLRNTGVRMPDDHVYRAGDPIPEGLVFPLIAKTPKGGSTIGIQRVASARELPDALAALTRFEDTVLLEQLIVGEEITVAVLDGTAMPVVSIRPKDREGFFDFEAKYTEGCTEYIVPAPISAAAAQDASAQAVIAYERISCAGIARADFIVDAEDRCWFLEVNTIPGMTATSLSPMAAGARGIDFPQLVEHIARTATLHVPLALAKDTLQPGKSTS